MCWIDSNPGPQTLQCLYCSVCCALYVQDSTVTVQRYSAMCNAKQLALCHICTVCNCDLSGTVVSVCYGWELQMPMFDFRFNTPSLLYSTSTTTSTKSECDKPSVIKKSVQIFLKKSRWESRWDHLKKFRRQAYNKKKGVGQSYWIGQGYLIGQGY